MAAMRGLKGIEMEKRTKDNLFVGLKPKWRYAAIDINGNILLFACEKRPFVGEYVSESFGRRRQWTTKGALGEVSCFFGELYEVAPWINTKNLLAWENSLIERPEGV